HGMHPDQRLQPTKGNATTALGLVLANMIELAHHALYIDKNDNEKIGLVCDVLLKQRSCVLSLARRGASLDIQPGDGDVTPRDQCTAFLENLKQTKLAAKIHVLSATLENMLSAVKQEEQFESPRLY